MENVYIKREKNISLNQNLWCAVIKQYKLYYHFWSKNMDIMLKEWLLSDIKLLQDDKIFIYMALFYNITFLVFKKNCSTDCFQKLTI